MLSFPDMILKPGYPISSYYGYKSVGIWQQDQETEAAKYGLVPVIIITKILTGIIP